MSNYDVSDASYQPRILVVDDEPRIRDACGLVLSEDGFLVESAPDGETGLDMIAKTHFDIVLVDLMLPTLSGLEVLARIRQAHQDTVVIVITGYATVEHSIEAMKKGAFDFIPKPFTPEQLKVVVRKAIRHNQALRDIATANSRLHVVVNRLMDGVMITDSQKRIVLANPAFLHLTGAHGENIVGRPVEEVIAVEALIQAIDEALANPSDSGGEIHRELALNGTGDRFLWAKCSPFKGRMGNTLGTITVLHDITALKKMDRMKSDFVSLVSHEIRSPMNSLLMQIKVILDGLAGEITEKQKEILGRVSGKIRSLIDLVSEILDLSRIESGLIAQEKTPVRIAELLKEQVSFHQALANEKGISLTLDAPPDLPPLPGNLQSLEEVASNLITNAIKYSPEGAEVKVSAREENGYIRIDIADTGFGIPEEDQKKVFEKFYRVKAPQYRQVLGTGLGLSIVKSIVSAHHGSIKVRSAPGKGSTFTVHLPLCA